MTNKIDQTKGLSSSLIYEKISEISKDFHPKSILDIGCGQGKFAQLLREYHQVPIHGTDIKNFNDPPVDHFIPQDFNKDLSKDFSKYEMLTAIEVIEHLENGRDFLRKCYQLLAPTGILIITTPNIESLPSLLSFILRGHHLCFGPKDYPAHIVPYSLLDLKRALLETGFEVCDVGFFDNARIPLTHHYFSTVLPFLKGKRFSENFYVITQKKPFL